MASSYANLSEQKKVVFFFKGKGLNPTGLVWNTNMAAVLLFRNTNVADVRSCEKALLTFSPGPLFQNEVKCSAFDMEIIFHSHANKTHFHKKGCALGLILKVRVFGTRRWPIAK